MRELDNFYMRQDEPIRGCFLALREIILSQDKNIVPAWKWQLPFFYFKKEMYCYLSFHKKYKKPYLAIVDGHLVEHPALLAEKRKRIRIMLVDPEKDLPIETIEEILRMAIQLYD